MAIFSCGSLAKDQIIKSFITCVELLGLSPEDAADCVLPQNGPPVNEENRTIIRNTLRLKFANEAAANPQAFEQVIDLTCAFTGERAAYESQQVKAMMDINSGFQTLQRAGACAPIHARPDQTLAQWVHAPNPGLNGLRPVDLMKSGPEGMNAIAAYASGDKEFVVQWLSLNGHKTHDDAHCTA
jgi:hypothetical protein